MGVRRTETALIAWTGSAAVARQQAKAVAADPINVPFDHDAFFDAGDQGCGDGPLDTIAGLLRKMQSGQTLAIHATDPSVAVDLAAWSRMTGNQVLDHQGAYYLIRRN